MEIRISPRLNAVLEYAREEAMRTGTYAIGIDHLTLGILRDADNDACRSLSELGIDPREMKDFIDSQLYIGRSIPFCDSDKIIVSTAARNAINVATLEALKAGVMEVSTSHLLMAICRTCGNASQTFMKECGITPDLLFEQMKKAGILSHCAKTVTPSPTEVAHIIKLPNTNSKIFS